MSARFVRSCVAVALCALIAGCGGRKQEPPALLLITLDTFRLDHLGCAGNPVVRTPHLDRIARRGTMWPDAVTPIPLTTPSHATILTGVSPRTHGVLRNRTRLPDERTTLPERLSEAGFRTGAIVSSRIVLDPELGLMQGFDTYEVVEPLQLPASGQGATTAERAEEWLRREGGSLSFLWVHFFDAHLPYLPPAPWPRLYGAGDDPPALFLAAAHESLDADARQRLRARYAGEVSFLDGCVGRVARAFEATLGTAPGFIVVTADHGEGLGEHDGYFGHDLLLYESVLSVPLVVAPARHRLSLHATPSGVSTEIARTLDIAPTLGAFARLAEDPEREGRDLLNEPPPSGEELALVCESHPEQDKAQALYALRVDQKKVVWKQDKRRRELYDLAADPGEQHELGDTADPIFKTLAEDLEIDLRERPPRAARTIDEERGGITEETRRALESLGYVGK